jgi:hypothetical protein
MPLESSLTGREPCLPSASFLEITVYKLQNLIRSFAKSVTHLEFRGKVTDCYKSFPAITCPCSIAFQSYTLSNDAPRPKFKTISLK